MNEYVKQIQTILKDGGYYGGAIDGIAGKQTLLAVQRLVGKEPTAPVPSGELMMSNKGMELLKEFEGFRSAPYQDIVGVWTIGYGNTYYPDGRRVSGGDRPLSEKEAHDLKLAVINKDFAPYVRNSLKASTVPVTQNMFDACVSLAYNIGTGAFARSSVVRQLTQGNKKGAADAFLLWNKAGGKVVRGLQRRREKERQLFLA